MRSSRALIAVALVAALALVWFVRAERRGPSLPTVDGASAEEPPAARLAPSESPATSTSPTESEPAEAREAAPIPLESAPSTHAVSFRVTDPDDQPLADARLRTLSPTPDWQGTTDAQGRAEFVTPAKFTELHFEVEHEGYAHLRTERDARAPILVVLQHALTLRGRVGEGETHRPLPGAVVERKHESCSDCAAERVVADADGRYELSGIPCGPRAPFVELVVRAEEHVSLRRGFVVPRVAPEYTLDVELEPGLERLGRVVDFDGGAPVAGAKVELGLEAVVCDAEGRFRTRSSATARSLELVVRAPGFCKLQVPSEGLESPLLVRLPRAASLTGSVRDPAGESVSGALVYLWDQGSFAPLLPAEFAALPAHAQLFVNGKGMASTDEHGDFRLEGLVPAQESYALDVTAEGYEESVQPLRALRSGEEGRQDVVLEPSARATIFGEFTLNGEAVNGLVSWRTAQGEGDAVQAHEGAYRIESAPVGALTVSALPGGVSLRAFLPESEAELTSLVGAELRHDFHLVLPMAPIAGHVRFSDGRPVSGVDVRVRREQGGAKRTYGGTASWSVNARTDGEGAFRTNVPARGVTFAASVRLGSVVRERAALAAGTEDVELVLPAMAELSYRAVERGSGTPVQPIGLLWRPAGSGEYEWCRPENGPDPDGFVRTSLPAGAVDLWLHAGMAGYAPDRRDGLRLEAAGEATRVTFELTIGESLTLQFDPPASLPERALVVLTPAEFWSDVDLDPKSGFTAGGRFAAHALQTLFIGKEGRCVVTGLAPGRYRLKAFHASLAFEPEEVVVPAEGPLVIRWAQR